MIPRRWPSSIRVLTLALLVLLGGATASEARPAAPPPPPIAQAPPSIDPAPLSMTLAFGLAMTTTTTTTTSTGLGPASVDGSGLSTEACYDDDVKSQTLCFTAYNGSTNFEWLDMIRLTFPDTSPYGPWSVSCGTQDATDSTGSPVNMNCTPVVTVTNAIRYEDGDKDGIGEIAVGASWGFCVDVGVPAGYDGPRLVNWHIEGDMTGLPGAAEGTTSIAHCTPLMLTPAQLAVEGCNGVPQTYEFELWNYATGSPGIFDLTYNVLGDDAVFEGPDSFILGLGEIVTFTAQLMPDRCLQPGEQVTVTLSAAGNGHGDSSTIVHTVTPLAGWQDRASIPVRTMDTVVASAVHDGGLWAVDGAGTAHRYDPAANTWTTHTAALSPTIEYPIDGCYGLNGDGDEVMVLFPDTIVTGTLHIYNITADAWYTQPTPAGYPPEGRWGHDVVSLYGLTGANVCYLSGGAAQPGGGRTKDLWRYDPASNSLQGYWRFYNTTDTVFGFHASWYVPWVGSAGAICVGGGVDHNSIVHDSTQCFDLATESMNAVNGDLGPLPEPWWGMADGWQTYKGRHQIWIANGVAQDGTLLPASAYADETTGGFVAGPALPVGLYRLEGTGWNGQFYALGGSEGGFAATRHTMRLTQCPACANLYLPACLRDYGP